MAWRARVRRWLACEAMEGHRAERTPRREVTCPSCGRPADAGQLVCLECGARLALDYRRPLGWKLPVAVITVVVLLAGSGLAYALSEIDGEAETEVASAPARKTTGKDKRGSKARAEKAGEKPAKAVKPSDRKPAAKRPEARPAPRRTGTWPTGRNGFTVVLVSTDQRSNAASVARDVSRRGTRAGYLRSDDFSSLEPGLWLVFSGVYRTRGEAERAVRRISRAFPGAFPQFINGAGSKRRR